MYNPVGIPATAAILASRLKTINGSFRYFKVWLPGCWLGIFLDILAISLYLPFKKQRKFPNIIVAMLCAVDSLHFLREIIKGSPIPYINEEWYWSPGTTQCATLWLWVTWVECAQYVLALSLALVIYVSVVKKESISPKHNKKYVYGTLIAFIVYPIVYTFIMAGVVTKVGFNMTLNTCFPANNAPPIMGIVQCFIVVTVLIFFIGMTLRYPYPYVPMSEKRPILKPYIWQVLRSADTIRESRQKKKVWITLRFCGIIILQAVPRFGFNIYYLILVVNPDKKVQATAADVSSYCLLIGYLLNCVMAFVCNKGLHEWIAKHILGFAGKKSSGGSSTPSDEDNKKRELKEYKLQAAVSSDDLGSSGESAKPFNV